MQGHRLPGGAFTQPHQFLHRFCGDRGTAAWWQALFTHISRLGSPSTPPSKLKAEPYARGWVRGWVWVTGAGSSQEPSVVSVCLLWVVSVCWICRMGLLSSSRTQKELGWELGLFPFRNLSLAGAPCCYPSGALERSEQSFYSEMTLSLGPHGWFQCPIPSLNALCPSA